MTYEINCLSSGEDRSKHIIETSTGRLLFSIEEATPCPQNWEQSGNRRGEKIAFAYAPEQNLLATYVLQAGWYNEVVVWSKRNYVWQPIQQLDSQGFELEFTPDGDYLRARNINAWKIYSVDDILRAAREIREIE
jgi:hypothetical protein